MHIKRRRPAGEIGFTILLLALSAFMLWTAYGAQSLPEHHRLVGPQDQADSRANSAN
jgi:hypothetical protein